jgi:hypothetical protein
VRWTDLRMILAADGTDPLPRVSRGLALSNWEI